MTDSRLATYQHISLVQAGLLLVITDLLARQAAHDQSKLASPEREAFDEFTPKLAGLTYGSDEYKACLAAMKPALDHHYAVNDHHPEHYGCNVCIQCGAKGPNACTCGGPTRAGMDGMSLVALLEMLCDWCAASKRHNDGDILKSIELNQKRFGYTDELKQILLNTLPLLGPMGQE